LGLPCFSSGRLEPRSSGSNQAPVESRTTPRRMRSLRRAACEAGAAVVEHAHEVAVGEGRAPRHRRDGA
jgi:hypothetical protein